MRSIARRSLIVLAAAAALAMAACNKSGGASGGAVDGDMTMGPATAKVTVIEYASVTCSHCARWNGEVFPEFKKKYIDTGKVKYVFREFLTPPMDAAAGGFLLARCTGKDKYFGTIDALMHSQGEMFETQDPRGWLLKVAQTAGMSENAFNKCVGDEAALKALNARVEKAQKEMDITGTPTFYVNGKKLDGETSIEKLSATIDPLLAAK
jgi:protein-disulfide isomerase